jgi:hypothetical protein
VSVAITGVAIGVTTGPLTRASKNPEVEPCASRVNKPRTISDKLAIYRGNIARRVAKKVTCEVIEEGLTKLILTKENEPACGKIASQVNSTCSSADVSDRHPLAHHPSQGIGIFG